SFDPHGLLGGVFAELPAEHQERFLRAPEVHFRLRVAKMDVKFLLGALFAEARLASGRAPVKASMWTPTGDWYFPEQPGAAVADGSSFSPDAPYRAPRLANGIPVDLVSPYARKQHALAEEDFIALEREQAQQAVATIVGAMDKVATVIPLND